MLSLRSRRPELETRESKKEPKQFLVFYPFALLPIADLTLEPLSLDEAPATTQEKEFMRDARVVEKFEDAEQAERKLREESGLRRSDSRDETEITRREEEQRRVKLDKAVEQALKEENEESSREDGTESPVEVAAGKPEERKKWLGWF